MNRRQFFTTSAGAVLLPSIPGTGAPPSSKPVLTSCTAEDHRRRLGNIRICEQGIRRCLRKHLVTNYIPGQAVYDVQNSSWEPDERDHRALARFRDAGVGLIQPWSGWAGSAWGKNHLVARNPAGFRKLVNLAHQCGLKVIPYTSSQFFERTDPNFRDEWAWPKQYDLVEFDYHLAHCSPASPQWRAYILPRMLRVMDEYGVDGLYNDLGYIRPGDRPSFYGPAGPAAKDDVLAFEESPSHDGAMADFLALVYEEVKRRGGIYKLHKEGADTVHTPLRIYDYLWTGEAVNDPGWLRAKTKTYEPYVVPQRLINLKPGQENDTFLNAIPYMRFPMLGHGQPGEQGAQYWADFVRWLELYLPMVEEGTWVWIEIAGSDWFQETLPRDVVASAFANRELYLVLANYGTKPAEIATAGEFVSEQAVRGKVWKLPARSLAVLRRA